MKVLVTADSGAGEPTCVASLTIRWCLAGGRP